MEALSRTEEGQMEMGRALIEGQKEYKKILLIRHTSGGLILSKKSRRRRLSSLLVRYLQYNFDQRNQCNLYNLR